MDKEKIAELAMIQGALAEMLEERQEGERAADVVAEAVVDVLDSLDIQHFDRFDLGIYQPEEGGSPADEYCRDEDGWHLSDGCWQEWGDCDVVSIYLDGGTSIWLDLDYPDGGGVTAWIDLDEIESGAHPAMHLG